MKWLSLFSPNLPANLVYMLQVSEYRIGAYLTWFWQAENIGQVMRRQRLDMTGKAKALLAVAWISLGLWVLAGLWWIVSADDIWSVISGTGWLLLSPIVLSQFSLPVAVWLGQWLVQKPTEYKMLKTAKQTLADHQAVKIAVAGSYGKTTMKNLLATVIAEGKQVAVTPGNLNTPLGLAKFASNLNGDEEVLVLELGESHPGDVAQLCRLASPSFGVITGVNEAHLSTMGSVEAATDTIFELVDHLGPEFVVGNGESQPVKDRADKKMLLYSQKGIGKWKVGRVTADINSTRFTIKKGKKSIKVESKLLGKHQVGPLAAAVDIADALGLSQSQIETGLAKVEPVDYRFKPYDINGAIVIDDTYNGNPDGMKAGIDFVKSLSGFKRKIYVTPGLVEVADAKARLHRDIGKKAAGVFDQVVLMKNSNLPYLKDGLKKGKFKGELIEVDDPLVFYQNMESMLAAGDVVLMQNDLPDGYA